jgi:hypothetical protein
MTEGLIIILVSIVPSGNDIEAVIVASPPAAGAFIEKDFLPIPDRTFLPSRDQDIKTLSKLLA